MNKTTNKTPIMEHFTAVLEVWKDAVLSKLPYIVLAIVILVFFIIIGKIIKNITLRFYKKAIRKQPEIALVISSAIYFFFIFSGIYIALRIVGFEQYLTHMIAGAGIVGIIAGFAFKDIASNMFAGMLLKMQNPFKVGDWVNINNQYGFIMEVGWITTKIHTVPGQEVYVPNQLIYNSTFVNYSAFGKSRVILETGVSYGDDLEKVRAVAIDEVKKIADVLTDEAIDFYFTQIGDSAYNFQLRFWIKFQINDDYQRAMSDIIISIKKRFEQENISIAYPVTTLDFEVKGGVNIFDKPLSINR